MTELGEKIRLDIQEQLFGQKIMSNLVRHEYVERLVVHALGGDWEHVGADWAGWDIEHQNSGARIEVKQSAARQTWSSKPTVPAFDIKPRKGYYEDGDRWIENAGRYADIYIFAWHPRYKPMETVDHWDEEQWEFYCIEERGLPNQGSIALSRFGDLGAQADNVLNLRTTVETIVSELLQLKCDVNGKVEQQSW